MSLRFRLVFAGACSLLAVLAFCAYAGQVRAEAEKVRSDAIARYGGEIVSLVVANRQIEEGETVSAGDVARRDWIADLAPDGAMTSPDEIVGKKLTVACAKGAPVTKLNLRDDGGSIEVPSGHISVGIPLADRIGVSVDTPSGTKVVAYTTNDRGTSLLASNMVVLSVAKGGSGSSGAGLSLAVLPDDVSKVLSASAAGELRLVVPADDVASLPKGDESAPSSVSQKKEGN